jgi:hypothetical protein
MAEEANIEAPKEKSETDSKVSISKKRAAQLKAKTIQVGGGELQV